MSAWSRALHRLPPDSILVDDIDDVGRGASSMLGDHLRQQVGPDVTPCRVEPLLMLEGPGRNFPDMDVILETGSAGGGARRCQGRFNWGPTEGIGRMDQDRDT